MAAWISIFISYPQFLTVPFHCVKFPKQAQKEQKERARFETVKFQKFANSKTGTTGTTGTKKVGQLLKCKLVKIGKI